MSALWTLFQTLFMTNISLLFETISGLSGCGVSNVIYMLFSFLLFRCLKRCFYSHLHAVSNVLFSSVLEWRRVFIRNVFFLVWRCCRAILQLVENRWWIEGWQRRICPVCHSKRQNVRSKAVRSIRTERGMPERFRRRLKRGFRTDANAFFRGGSRRREKACRSGEKACSKRLFSVFAFGSFLST